MDSIITQFSKQEKVLRKIILFFIITIIFVSTCIQIYSLLFLFFEDLAIPDLFFRKEIVIAFLILFSGLEISKCILIFKIDDLNIFIQFLYSIALTSLAVGFLLKLLYLIGITSLIIVVIALFEAMEGVNYNALFFINLTMLIISTLLAFTLYVLCIVN